jgi:hypothetical protein
MPKMNLLDMTEKIEEEDKEDKEEEENGKGTTKDKLVDSANKIFDLFRSKKDPKEEGKEEKEKDSTKQ